MEEIIAKLATQIPSLLVLVFLTMKFLAHLEKISKGYSDSIEKIQEKNERAFTSMASECHAVQDKSIESLNKVDRTLVENNLLVQQNINIHRQVLTVLEKK